MEQEFNLLCIIDDDKLFRFGTKKLFQLKKYCNDFLIFKNGQEAYEHFSVALEENLDLPEVILLDINMPVMNGWQFLDSIIKVKNAKKLQILIVSSSVDHTDIKKAHNHPLVKDYIIKPIDLKKLKKICQLTKVKNL